MAKMFLTMDETKAALQRTEDEIKQLCREGKLREFRDGPKLMFKADQVEALKNTLPPRDTVDIADSGAPISLVDSKSGTASGGSAPGTVSIKEDTSAGDTGLSGSFGGVPSPRAANQASGTGSGIGIFEEADSTDSSAQTALTGSGGGGLEPGGSGSGLLDLTRESDDTSIGAVLEDIPTPKRDPSATGTGMGAPGVAAAAPAAGAAAFGRVNPVVVTKPDATAPFFGGLALGGAVLSLFALFVVTSAVTGASVVFLKSLVDLGFLLLLAAGAVVVLVFGGIGFGLGKVIK
ncbi:MAG: hypothetical protein ACK4PI_06970 [Tepidisphaerales bacterium]